VRLAVTVRLGRIGGDTVAVNWTVLVIVWLLMWSLAGYTLPDSAAGHPWPVYWAVGLVSALGLVASILAHELSHAVIARRDGVAVQDITLWMFGGVARLGGQAGDPATELKVAVAGPATSLAIGAACIVLAGISAGAGAPDLLTVALALLGVINVVLAVFNLLPSPGSPVGASRLPQQSQPQHARPHPGDMNELVGIHAAHCASGSVTNERSLPGTCKSPIGRARSPASTGSNSPAQQKTEQLHRQLPGLHEGVRADTHSHRVPWESIPHA
jgi:hypothetical protein